MENYKDVITTICGYLVAATVAVAAADKMWPNYIPQWIVVVAFIIGGTAAYKGFQQIGKNPDGSKKTLEQATTINNIGKQP